jgi:exopolyphosphatase/guanosine-5'-triphosphate,3'-diphosphate pyrophosphatase
VIPQTPAVKEALALMRDWEEEPQHVLHVTAWAVQLFENLRPEHKLGSRDLTYLTAGALLHDTGWSTANEERPHHKESARRIREHTWQNLSPKEREFVALVARYHRKSPPSAQHHRYRSLESSRREPLRWLAGILRVADAMDRSHRQKLRFEKLELRPGVCLIHAQGEGQEEANFGLDRKGDLLHQVSGRQPFLKFTPS